MAASPAPLPLDSFIPHPDVRERFEVVAHAPALLVLEVASQFDLQSLPLVRAIFRTREILMRAPPGAGRRPLGIVAETLALGWGMLAYDPSRAIVMGAHCQPWRADVTFHAIPSERFASYAEPAQVKIAWTLEVEPIGPAETRFAHETRVQATDDEARRRFRRYWRWARFGIVAIRFLMMPAVRRAAEARWQSTRLDGRKGLTHNRTGDDA